MGTMRMPDSAPITEANRKAIWPDRLVRMPTSRAPIRLTAVARSALPYSVRPKNSHSATMKAMVAA